MNITYRFEPVQSDLVGVADMLSRTGVFTEREIVVAQELIEDRIAHGSKSEYSFVFADLDGVLVGYVCYGLITITEDRYDLYWIAVDPSSGGRGIGRGLMAHSERLMRRDGGSYVFVDTSSRDVYAPARGFYSACGYTNDATVHNYFSDGDHKVIFSKKL